MAPSPPHASTAPPGPPGLPSAGKAPPAAAAQAQAQAQAQAAPPAQTPDQEALARQLQALGPLPLDGAVISQFLAGYHTGQLNTAGRPTLAVGPRLAPDASETLPLVGEELRSECPSVRRNQSSLKSRLSCRPARDRCSDLNCG